MAGWFRTKNESWRGPVEIKGYRREDAKKKKATMETYWVPGVNNHGQHGRWAFKESLRCMRPSGLWEN